MTTELFENLAPAPPAKQAKAAKPKATMRLEFYNNGPDCKWPVTQYGLLWDIKGSQQRCNLNFGIVDMGWVSDHLDSAQLTSTQHAYLEAVAERYVEIGNRDCLVTFGKWNGMSGTGAHDLKQGVKGMFFGTAALVQLNEGQAPTVDLFHMGEWFTLDKGWQSTPYSNHPAKLWQVRF